MLNMLSHNFDNRITTFTYVEILLLSYAGIILFFWGNTMITPWVFFNFLFILHTLKTNTIIDISFLLFCLCIISIININTLHIASLAHMIFYLVTLLTIIKIITSYETINISFIENLSKIIILSYFINVIISVILSHIGYNGWLNIFFKYSIDSHGSIRYPGFASEASYLAFTLTYAALPLIYFNKNSNKKYLLFVAVTILISKTSYGIVCLVFLLAIYYINNLKSILIGIFLLFLLFSIMEGNTYLNRVTEIVKLIKSGSVESIVYGIYDVDGSASVRILPTYLYIIEGHYLNPHFLIGYGAGTSSDYFKMIQDFGKKEDEHLGLGFIPAFVHEYGVIFTFCLFYYLKKYLSSIKWYHYCFFIFSIFNYSFSTEIFLFSVVYLILLNKAINTYTNQ